MGTKIRVDQVAVDEIDDWNEQFTEEEELGRSRLKYNGKRRREIEDLMEERRLMRQIQDVYDEHA
ncbi:PA3496 family putative envelope integrity protein [Nitrincola sp. MINF-07-Sa-05]|uniref:PA3496 family putative envelope integrity protein n=1 Tax=Nitrincola salilacus TaxID=3400273 RepID=UPI0039181F63